MIKTWLLSLVFFTLAHHAAGMKYNAAINGAAAGIRYNKATIDRVASGIDYVVKLDEAAGIDAASGMNTVSAAGIDKDVQPNEIRQKRVSYQFY